MELCAIQAKFQQELAGDIRAGSGHTEVMTDLDDPSLRPDEALRSAGAEPESAELDPERRLSIHLTGKMASKVRELADRSGMKVSDVVKASVASFEFLDERDRRGQHILIEEEGGRLLTVPWPPRSPQ